MTPRTKIGAGVAAGFMSLLTLTIALPVLTVTGLIAPGGAVADALRSDTIPADAEAAYQRAADAARGFVPECQIPPWILAGVGQIETGHGSHRGSTVAANGDVSPPIIGPALPHLGGDTDNGAWDGSTTVDHAVGPMQFIPATWRAYGADGNNDGLVDPHNIYDAALAAAAYLCASAVPMATEDDWRHGLLAYNHSQTYVAQVLDAAYHYRDESLPRPASDAPGGRVDLVEVAGIGLTNASWAGDVRAMLAAAANDGLTLTGSSYRDPARQVALRRQHCGTSDYATYQMPSSQCRPPTARPGTSMHETGLAIDFDNCSSRSSSRSSACYQWLSANASSFGMRNLPSEPWHWSLTGQ